VRIGVLTGGGDCPGLNAVIRAIVRKGIDHHGHEIVGFRDGWRGPLEKAFEELTVESTRGILPRGGTILGTSRTNPFKRNDGPDAIRENLDELGLGGLIAIGGEDTLGAASRLHSEHDLPVLGVPKTIDNDLGGTDRTFGFDTALHVACEAIDRLHTTAESHNRVMVVEVMGRHAGWIACYSGIAGGADVILVPERPFDIDAVCDSIKRRHAGGRTFSIVVVSEGAVPQDGSGITTTGGQVDAFGHARLGGIGVALEREIEARTGFETRMTILGHVQRGGSPTAYDRVLATRFGVTAIDAASEGRFGTMVALRGTDIELVGLEQAVAEPKLLDPRLYATAEVFFG
jgi:phosphofructokinase-like protein